MRHIHVPVSLLFCAMTLHSTPTAGQTVSVSLDLEETRSPINPFIYGQFIEHLGRCVYGGIWAEMLEDRKFYFAITADYDPYKSLTDTPFPVVGASPWQIIGDAAAVTMIEEDSFVGDHTPRIGAGAGIRQRDLGIVEGKTYEGTIWLKSDGSRAGPVTVALIAAEGETASEPHTIRRVSDTYGQHAFEFTAGRSSDAALLEIRNEGDTPVFVGTVSLMPGDNIRGMRADTLARLKELDAPMYRWPGGNFVSGYDWRDGIGPRDRRPPRKNPAWTGVEHNDVGIDEFIDFCRELNAEPLIAANTGFGDAYSAAQEVEYCNGGSDTIGGSWRVGNGHREPYNVKYWCVGNEMFGPWQHGFMQLRHYVEKHNRFARQMRAADPTIELIGVGNLNGRNPNHDPEQRVGWSEGMLNECADSMEYISEHFYRGRTPWNPETRDVPGHVAMMRESIREKVEGHRKLQERLGLVEEKQIPIAMDEWNYWHNKYEYGELGCVYNLQDALGIAAGLHEYFRSSDIVKMAHYAQTVNVIGCVKTTKTDAFLDSTALPLMLYRKHFGTVPIAVTGDFESRNLDVAAALIENGSAVTIGAVNPNDEPVTIRLASDRSLGTDGRVWTVSGSDPHLQNDPEHARLQPQETDVTVQGEWTVPGYSFSILRLPVSGPE